MENEAVQRMGPGDDRHLQQVIEVLLFAADEPVTPNRISRVFSEVTGMEEPSPDSILALTDQLNNQYEKHGRTFRIHKWAGGIRLATEKTLAPYLKAFAENKKKRRLSRSLMETLAVLAYRQPVTKPEIDFVRGVDSDYALRRLLEHGLVDVIGRDEAVGRPLIYGTTSQFLEQFGLNDLDDLPNLREIEALLQDPAFNHEKARLLMNEGLIDPVRELPKDTQENHEASE